jgi:hypothetical protein|tara:strand:- start:25997 stop:27547 length:1551 start_codon:yes stop_codon:yes gene_type:complete
MFKVVEFRSDVEELVRFVEETDPADIVAKAYQKLKAGSTRQELLTASTLAVVRSTELPPQHHGGPVHPVCGVHAVQNVSERLSGDLSFLPVIQHAALCNNHVHSIQMGPYLMPAIEPMAGTPGDIGSFHISDTDLTEGMTAEQRRASTGIEATKGAFHKSLRAMQAPAAEHYYLWLLEHLSHSAAIDQLLPLAIARNGLDDHNFLFPVYTARALDCIGWEWAEVLMRAAVRFQARRAPRLIRNDYDFADIQALIKEYRLLDIDIPERTSAAESDQISRLAWAMGTSKQYLRNSEVMAAALAAGLSLEGAGEALSIGAAAAYVSTSYGNPMDSHLHTGTNNRRYLLRQPAVSLENKLLGLLTGFTGPEVLLAERLLNWEDNLSSDATKSLPDRSQEQLLDAITESIEGQPWLDWRKIGVAQTVAPDSVKETVALARLYADKGYDAKLYFDRLAEIACRDDFTEMHALKHFQAIVDEYYSTGSAHQWLHLVAAAKSAAIVHLGREHRIYEEAKTLIAA